MSFQSTQPKRAATYYGLNISNRIMISIHAAQEGCDLLCVMVKLKKLEFQSTQPKRAATCSFCETLYIPVLFQSTQPKRAATRLKNGSATPSAFQSTQPKRAATAKLDTSTPEPIFQSTQPKRAATAYSRGHQIRGIISIHAAQEGCDHIFCHVICHAVNFNPRSPKGLRLE